MQKTVLFAGSFDPFTIGHLDIVLRASKMFEHITIGVAGNTGDKKCFLSLEQRLEIVKRSVEGISNISVKSFDGFLVDFAAQIGAFCLVRGLRTANDFEYEKSITQVYKTQNSAFETFYLISSPINAHVSGSVVRELIKLGGKLHGYVSEKAEEYIRQSFLAKM